MPPSRTGAISADGGGEAIPQVAQGRICDFFRKNLARDALGSYYGRMTIPRTVYKGHGTANDFVVYADPDGVFKPTDAEIRFLCDRHRGLGGDGLLRLVPTRLSETIPAVTSTEAQRLIDEGAEWFMDYYNADGSIAEMCGNGSRVITLFAQMLGIAPKSAEGTFALATRAGVKRLTSLGKVDGLGEHVFQVDMGAWKIGERDKYRVVLDGTDGSVRGTFVDIGNPHIVCLVDDLVGVSGGVDTDFPGVEALDLSHPPRVSPPLEHGQNVEFVRIERVVPDGGSAFMRVSERGVGETLSCGTGLCATGVLLSSITDVNNWMIRVHGVVVKVVVSDDKVVITGDAKIVGTFTFTGEPSEYTDARGIEFAD